MVEAEEERGRGKGKEGGGQASGVLRASNPAFSDITVGPLYSLATFPECLPPCLLRTPLYTQGVFLGNTAGNTKFKLQFV